MLKFAVLNLLLQFGTILNLHQIRDLTGEVYSEKFAEKI